MSIRPILVIKEDNAVRDALAEQLTATGEFDVNVAATLSQATELLEADNARFDVIILDINLPDGDGCDFCGQLRQDGCKVPVIMLGSPSETDVIRGLEAGANDYITKPFRVNELIARIHTQLRTFDNSIDAVYTVGSYTFRPSAKLLQKLGNSRSIRLTGKEVEIIKFLHKTSDACVSRQTLLDSVWGYHSGTTTHTLETHIYKLRQKIEMDPKDCQLLITVAGGYRLAKAHSAAQAAAA